MANIADLGALVAAGRAPGADPPASTPRAGAAAPSRPWSTASGRAGTRSCATEVGTPQPLPPELEVVAYRVLQEMLTNAIKHGRRDQPVLVERHWPDGSCDRDLRIEVRNAVGSPTTATEETVPLAAAGTGLDGMRRRLASVGGRLDVRRRERAGDEARPSPSPRGCR